MIHVIVIVMTIQTLLLRSRGTRRWLVCFPVSHQVTDQLYITKQNGDPNGAC